jgi:Pyruvate/2-oxoacid:ferredoxin oxidoreductase delta subunit
MSFRKIVHIDEGKCDGCGLCVPACAEGAIQIVEGKAKLASEVYCDGLGACLGECPRDAISIEEREAAQFDAVAVQQHLNRLERGAVRPERDRETAGSPGRSAAPSLCPGSTMRRFARPPVSQQSASGTVGRSQLGHWPIQLMLVAARAPYLKNADIVVCADCVPFAVPDFHDRYLAGRAVLVGCPKLDDLGFYHEKLKTIFAQSDPAKLTVLRMEVPCCGGIAHVAIEARNEVTPNKPVDVHTVGIRGGIRCESVPSGKVA